MDDSWVMILSLQRGKLLPMVNEMTRPKKGKGVPAVPPLVVAMFISISVSH